MKMAYLANVRLPSERAHAAQITHMLQAFAKSGVEVTLYANTRSNQMLPELGRYFFIEPRFSLCRLRYGLFFPGFKPGYYLSELIFSLHFLLHQKTKQFDIIYSRHEWVLMILSFFIPHKKLVWESHEARHSYAARSILKKKIKTVVISEGIFNDYNSIGYDKNLFHIAHDAVDESFFEQVETTLEARKRLGLSEIDHIVMYIGGFAAWKGIDTFCEASILSKSSTFVVIGGSSEEVLRYKQKYPTVVFLGQRPYAELKDNQQAADILVIPNSAKEIISTEYTSPLKLFAHMASGKPLIVSNVSSILRVTGNTSVTVFEADSVDGLAKAIDFVRSTSSPPVVSKNIASRYTWTSRAEGIIDFITTR